MSYDFSMETDEVLISAMPEATDTSQVQILRNAGATATDSFAPDTLQDAASGDAPEVVSGYVSDNQMPEADVETSPLATPADDGRYTTEVIIGTDDRVRVQATNTWPYSVHGHMRMRFPNGRTYIGTGTMVNRHHVLTAGHCVYSAADGGWATSVSFEAARNGANRPFGTHFANRLLSVTGWTQHANTNYDMAMLVLSTDLGQQTGWTGVITGPDSLLNNHRVNVTGFPGDKANGTEMWTHADAISAVAAERFHYMIDTMGGNSGGGVYSKWQGHPGEKVCGIHTTGSQSGNGATRISRPKFDRIVDWMSQY
jgi:V8-like Glu-specific endopeptidase